jgi:hypothetical protein
MSVRRYVEVAGTQYSKKGFGARWSAIVSGYEVGLTISPDDSLFVSDVLGRISRFARIMDRGKVQFRVVQRSFNGKRVKGIALVTPNSGHEVWVGKQVVVKAMFPNTTIPDQGKVQSAGRCCGRYGMLSIRRSGNTGGGLRANRS